MLTKHGLRCIDNVLKEIMINQQPFGGKVIVVGGDFRQTLPVVVRGTRVDVIECCIKSSPLWYLFKKLTLTTNMRSVGQNDFNDWLLQIGSGFLPELPNVPINSVEIPNMLLTDQDLIEKVYGADLIRMSVEDLAKRVILAPTNKETLQTNKITIKKLPGVPWIYNSADSIISEDPTDSLNYPPQFLHKLTTSGMPPHTLELKTGIIIMLLRNLNPIKGLCNGTRLVIGSLHQNFIMAKIVSEMTKMI